MVIFRDGKMIKLSGDELFQAYEEQKHIDDIQNIMDNMERYLDDKEYASLKDHRIFIENAAKKLKKNLDDGMGYEEALSAAFDDAKKDVLGLRPLSWEQVVFLWETGNRNFFRISNDGSEACVDLDEWNDIMEHHDRGGEFAIEATDIFKWGVAISSSTDAFEFECGESPDSQSLLQKCKERRLSGELHVVASAMNVDGEYVDSNEYFIFVSQDYTRIYLHDE